LNFVESSGVRRVGKKNSPGDGFPSMNKFRFAAVWAVAALLVFAAAAASAQEGEQTMGSAEQALMELSMAMQSLPDPSESPDAQRAFAAGTADLAAKARAFVLAHPEHQYAFPILVELYPGTLIQSGKSEAEVAAAMEQFEKEGANTPVAALFAYKKLMESLPEGTSTLVYYTELKGLNERHSNSPFLLGKMADVLGDVDGMSAPEKLAEADRLIATGKLDSRVVEGLQGFKKMASAIGTPVSFQFKALDGTAIDTAQWKGKVVLVDFWATWCGPCVAEMPRMKSLYDQYHAQGLEVIGISCDESAEPLQKFVAAKGIAWPQWPPQNDEGWHPEAKAWGVRGIPTMFLIDKEGLLRSVTARGELETLIPQLLAEKM
jgi:thiol-disulfide isomerase/thioredoxin